MRLQLESNTITKLVEVGAKKGADETISIGILMDGKQPHGRQKFPTQV